MVGISLDVFNALFTHSSTRQHVKSHLRARRRQPPIIVCRRLIGTPIRMTPDDDGTRPTFENPANLFHNLNGFWLRFGGTDGKHRIPCVIHETDKDAFGGYLNFKVKQVWHVSTAADRIHNI